VPNVKEHWDRVFTTKDDAEVSWTQPEPALSLSLVAAVCPPPGKVIDVGGGTSALAGRLLDAGYTVAVLDISEAGLARARNRLGERAGNIRWITADITSGPRLGEFDVWHDRAVFHFLTSPEERRNYVELAAATIPIGGHLIVGTFALDGPEKCSGLPVERYDGQKLAREFGRCFSLKRETRETHLTPWGTPQNFTFAVFERINPKSAD